MHWRHRVQRFAATTCLAAGLTAQAASARTGCVDADGKGAVATVHVHCVPQCGLPVEAVGPLTAGADGTFVLPAELGEHFAAFAVTATAASAVVERRGSHAPLELHLAPTKALPLQVDGLLAWRDEGPLRAFVLLPAAFDWRLPVNLDGRGMATLPPLPPGDALLELRTAGDGVLWRERLHRGMPELRIRLPEPVVVTLRVTDHAGAPLPGAQVRHEWGQCLDTRAAPFAVAPEWQHRQLGRTDAKGQLSIRLPRASAGQPSAFAGALRITHAEHAAARLGWAGDELDGGRVVDGKVEVEMAGAVPFDLTVHLGGVPFAHRRLLLFARVSDVQPAAEGFGFRMQTWHGIAETDVEGRATWPDFPEGAGELRLVPVSNAGERTPACVTLRGLPGQEIELGPVRAVAVQVRNAAGVPRPGVCVVAMPSPPDLMFLEPYGCEPRTVTDADGRARFELPRTRFWIAASDGEGWAHTLVDAAADGDDAPCDVALTLLPFATWDVQVERAGKPLAGAHFVLEGTRWVDGTEIPPERELLPLQWLGQFNWLLVRSGSADADGKLRVRFAPTNVTTTLGRVRGPDGGATASAEFSLGTAPLPQRIQLK